MDKDKRRVNETSARHDDVYTSFGILLVFSLNRMNISAQFMGLHFPGNLSRGVVEEMVHVFKRFVYFVPEQIGS